MPRKPLAGQLALAEDPSKLVIALNEDVRRSYRELLELEDEREQRRGELDTCKALIFTDDKGALRWSISRQALNHSEKHDHWDQKDKLQAAVSAATRAVNKQREKIIKQVGETIDAAEGTQRVEPMQH